MNKFKAGDTIIWRRSEAPVEARVLEARNGKVNLAIVGWLGTTWEPERSMYLASEWCPDPKMREEILRRYRNGIQLSYTMLQSIHEG